MLDEERAHKRCLSDVTVICHWVFLVIKISFFSLMSGCKYVFSPLDWGIKNSLCLFGLQCRARGWQKVNTKLIWALIFLMQTLSVLCVKVLTQPCTKFNKTSLCVWSVLGTWQSSIHEREWARAHRHERANAHTHAHTYKTHCEIVKMWHICEYYECLLISRDREGGSGVGWGVWGGGGAAGSNWL